MATHSIDAALEAREAVLTALESAGDPTPFGEVGLDPQPCGVSRVDAVEFSTVVAALRDAGWDPEHGVLHPATYSRFRMLGRDVLTIETDRDRLAAGIWSYIGTTTLVAESGCPQGRVYFVQPGGHVGVTSIKLAT